MTALLLAVLCAAPPAPASTPTETVRRIYALYDARDADPNWEPFLSKEVRKAFDDAHAVMKKPGVIGSHPLFTFDIVIQGQDWKVTEVKLKATKPSGGHCEVVATFKNFGEPHRVRFKLVLEDGLWRVDDVGADEEGAVTIRKQMATPPDLVPE